MLEFQLDGVNGIVRAKLYGALSRNDFAALKVVVDKHVAQTGVLQGLLIDMPNFPGWENADAFRAHMAFIDEYNRKIARIAIITRSRLLYLFSSIANFFLQGEVALYRDRNEALKWLLA